MDVSTINKECKLCYYLLICMNKVCMCALCAENKKKIKKTVIEMHIEFSYFICFCNGRCDVTLSIIISNALAYVAVAVCNVHVCAMHFISL